MNDTLYDGKDATITRLMPGFDVTLHGRVRRAVVDAKPGWGDRRFDSKRAAIDWVLAARQVAAEAPA